MKVADCPVCGSNTVIITKSVVSETYFGPLGTIAFCKRPIKWRIKCCEEKCRIQPFIEIDGDRLKELVRQWNKRNYARNYLMTRYRCFHEKGVNI